MPSNSKKRRREEAAAAGVEGGGGGSGRQHHPEPTNPNAKRKVPLPCGNARLLRLRPAGAPEASRSARSCSKLKPASAN